MDINVVLGSLKTAGNSVLYSHLYLLPLLLLLELLLMLVAVTAVTAVTAAAVAAVGWRCSCVYGILVLDIFVLTWQS